MFELLFSHYKVMPAFLDSLFTLGERTWKNNFGFRSKDLWMESNFDARVPSPPCRFQLCYNLRSVEHVKRTPEWPWSIRQAVIFHRFECDTGNAAWINVKNAEDLSSHIARLCLPSAPADPALMTTAKGTFGASLAAHIAFCQWSGKNWSAYISFLDHQLQKESGDAVLANGATSHPISAPVPLRRAYTWVQMQNRLPRAKNAILATARVLSAPGRTAASGGQNLELGLPEAATQDFVHDLEKLHDIEEQVNVALFLIKANINIMGELRDYYSLLDCCQAFQHTMGHEHKSSISRFSSHLSTLINDSKLQQFRIETMLRMVADSKALVRRLCLISVEDER
jgi:hypothetical protein